MKCECGGRMVERRENYFFSEETGGLPVTLAGVAVRTCASCGDREAAVPALLDLNAAICAALVRKAGRLVGAEIRFLRAMLGLSGVELARLIGATASTVSRWEKGSAPVGTQADKLLRLLVARQMKDGQYSLADIQAAAAEESTTPMRFTMSHTREGGWRTDEPGGRRKAA